jgi:hypothetical protein
MRIRVLAIWAAAAGLWAGHVHAQTAPMAAAPPAPLSPARASPNDSASPDVQPDTTPVTHSLAPYTRLSLVELPQSVYPETSRPPDLLNSGGVNFGLDVDVLTDYIYRGVDQKTAGERSENALQFDAMAKFNLGKLPHPFIGLFVNVFNNDPVSRFEEVRPYFGLEWNLKPFTVVGGFNSYIHPNRKNLDTQEVFASVTLDDSLLFHTPQPVLSPYVYGAYDIDLYNGFYMEAGVKHDFVFESLGLTLTPRGDIAYVTDNPLYMKTRSYGLQHYDVGLTAKVSINHLLNVDQRYGQWSVKGYMNYTGRIDDHLKADTLIWGGVGLEFRY